MNQQVTILDHPLIQHKITMLRDVRTGTNEFRKLIEEIAVLMGYEALRDLPRLWQCVRNKAESLEKQGFRLCSSAGVWG